MIPSILRKLTIRIGLYKLKHLSRNVCAVLFTENYNHRRKYCMVPSTNTYFILEKNVYEGV